MKEKPTGRERKPAEPRAGGEGSPLAPQAGSTRHRIGTPDLLDVGEAYARRHHRQGTVALLWSPALFGEAGYREWYESLADELDEIDVLLAPFLVVELDGLKAARAFAASHRYAHVSCFHRGKIQVFPGCGGE